jgi:hypothetical protein
LLLKMTDACFEFLPVSAFPIEFRSEAFHDAFHRLNRHMIRMRTSIPAVEEIRQQRG